MHQYYILKNVSKITMTITRDIIRVFYHTIRLYVVLCTFILGLTKNRVHNIRFMFLLGFICSWEIHIYLVSMIPGSGHLLYPVLAPGSSFWKGLRVMAGASTYFE